MTHLTATAQTPIQFVGGTRDWSDNATWSPQIVPTSVEDVSITNAGTLRLDTSPLINGLTLGNSSATLSADTAQSLFLSGPFTWSAGSLGNNVTVEAQSGSKTGNGTMQNAVLKLTGSWTHSAGFTSGGTFVNPLISIETNAVYDITFDGTATSGDNTDAITNHAGGTFRKSAGTGTSIVDWRFDNRGTVDVHTGTISLREGGNYAGTTTVSNGATLLFDAGTFTLANGGTASGAGTVQVETTVDTAGGATFTSAADLRLNTGGVLGGSGTLELNDTFLITGGTMNDSLTVNLNAGSIIGGSVGAQGNTKLNLNAGTLIHTNGLISGGTFHSPLWTVKSGATIDFQSDGTAFSGDNSDRLTNQVGGFIRKSAGTGNTVIDWFFSNQGDIDIQTGTLELNDSGTIGGTITVAHESALLYDAGSFSLTAGGAVNGSGTMRVETTVDVAGGATYTADSDLHLNTGGVLGGSGILNVNDTFLITSGAMNDSLTVNLNAGGIIGGSVGAQGNTRLTLNAGTLIHTNGLISGGTFNSPLWTITTNAILDLRFDGTSFSGDNSDRLTNQLGGTVRKSVGSGTSVIDWFFSNAGEVDVQTGTLELNDSGTIGGTISVANGSVMLYDAGSFSLLNGGTIGGDGTMRVETTVDVAGGATYNANSDLHLNTGGLLGGSGVLNANDTFLITSGAINDSLTVNLNAGGIIGGSVGAQGNMKLNLNAGTLSHTNGLISGGTFNSPLWTITTNAILDLRFDGTSFSGDNSDRLTNQLGGIVRKSSGTGTSVIDWFFSNEGQVDVQTGTIELNDSGTLGGTISLSNSSSLLLDAGSFSLVNGGNVNGAGTMVVDTTADVLSGATYTIGTDLHLNSSGLIGGSGTLRANDLFLIAGGAMNDSVTIEAAGGAIISASAGAQSNMKLNFTGGNVMHTNGAISAGTFNSPLWTVGSNVVYDIRFDGSAFLGDSSDRLTNNAGGTLRKSVGMGTSLVDWFFSNQGQVDVQTGTLELNDSGALAGNVSLASGAVLLLDAGTFAFLDGGAASGDGVIRVDTTADVASGATYTVNSDLQLDPAGVLGGSGRLELNDVLLIGGGAMNDSATINANAGGLMSASVGMQNTVKLNLTGGTFVHTNGSFGGGTFNDPTVAIRSGAIYDLRFDGTAFNGDTSDTVTNSPGATFRKSAGTGNSTVDWEFNSGGVVDIQSGTIRFISGGRFAGTNTVATNARWLLDGGGFSLANGGRVAGDGRWQVSTTADTAGGATFNSDSQTDLTSTGILGGSGTLNLNDPFNIQGGTINDSVTVNVNDASTVAGSLNMANTATMNVRGTMIHTAGTVSGGTFNDPNVRVLTNATYDIQADGTVYNGDGSDEFVVSAGGTLRRSVGTGNATVDWDVTQNGHVDVQTGTLDFNVGGSWGGTSQIASGAQLLFDNGTFSLSNGGQIGGDGTWRVAATADTVPGGAFDAGSPVQLASGGIFGGNGSLNVSGALHIQQGATVNDSVRLGATGGGTITGSSTFGGTAVVNFGGSFNHTGTVHGGSFNDPVVNLLSNAVYEVDLHGALFDGDSSDRLNILPGSTLRKTASTNFAFIDWTTTHGGNIEVLGGTLHFVREITQTNGSIRVAGGEFSVNNHLTLQAGLLTGSGLVDVRSASAVRNNGAVVAPGSSPGTLVIDGNYEQAAGGTLQIEIGGTDQGSEYDLLLVTNGSATLNGSLQITVFSNFLPQAGQSFTFMVADGGITGTFTNTPGNKYTIDGVGTFDVTYGTNEVRLGNFSTILTGPTITEQPRSQVARVGDSVNLTVTATGTPPLFYQWRMGSSIIANATNSTYSIPAASTNHTGSYSVVVSNAVASVISSNATLIVLPPSAPAPAVNGLLSIGSSASEEVEAMAVDANGNVYLAGVFSNSTTIGTNLLSAQGEDMFLAKLNASGNVSWAISAGGTGADAANAIAVDADGHVYVVGDTDSRPALFGTNSLTSTGGADGFVAKFSPLGSNLWARGIGADANDEAADVAVMSNGIAVVGQVRNSEASIRIGSLGVSGRGSDDGFVAKFDEDGNAQWARIIGGTGSDVVQAVAVDGESIYFGGEFRSTTATFNQGATFVTNQGGADLFVARFDQNGNMNWSSTVGTTGEETVNALSVRGDIVAAVGFFTSTTISFGADTLNNSGSEEAFLWGIRTNGQTLGAERFGGNGHERASDVAIDQAGNILVGGVFSSTSATFGTNTLGTPGTSGFLTTFTTNGGTARWALQIGEQSESIQAIGVGPNREIYAAGNFRSTQLQLGNGTIANQGDSDIFLARLTNDVIYVRRQPTNLVVNAGANSTFSAVIIGESPIRHQWFKAGSPLANATNATLIITATEAGDAGSYSLMASNVHGVATSATAFLSVNIPPTITSHPGDQSVILGAATGFSVSATGTLPLFYQWRKDGTIIPGATNASFNISSLTAANTGSYSVVVTNVAGFAVSSNANLTVLLPPTIASQPQNRTVAVGGSALLSVAATGAQPLFYQWRKNTNPLNGETNASLLITNAALVDSGNYDVIVSNQVTAIISSNAVVTVADVPVISAHPQSRTAREGATVIFGVAATGATAYQWRKDGAPINGATNTLLTLTKIGASAAGNYSVRVSNSFTNVVSSNAILTVSGSSVVAELGRWPENVRGEAFDVVYTNGHIYVASGPAGLKICTLTNGNTLNTIAQVDTDGSANALCLLNNRVYLADGEKGVKIIDVSDVFHPAIVGSFNTTTFAKDVFAIGNRLYVADLESGVHIGDISNPASPTRLGTFDTPGRAEGVFATGDHVYVADMTAGLHIVSVTNPASPTLVGTYNTNGFSRSVQVVDTTAYVADWSGGLRIVDVSNPASPTSIGVLTNVALAYDVRVSGSRAYVAGYNSGLRAVNISNPAAPGLLGTLNTAGLALGVDVHGSMAFVADWTGGLLVVNVANPAPQLVASKTAPGSAWDLSVVGSHAFIADFDAGLQIVNITDSENPSRVAQVDTPGSAVGVHVADNHAYVADYDRGLATIDVTDPSSPVQRGAINTAGYARAVDVSGEYAFVADDIAGLQVISISNPANLTRIGGVDTLGTAYAVKVHNNHAFVAEFERGLQIYSVTNPATPVRVGGINTDGEAWDLLLNGNQLFLADGSAGLKVFNISNPSAPTFSGSVDTTGNAVGLSLNGNLLAMADWTGGTRFFNISNPSSPSALVSLASDVLASGVQIVGDHAFVAARNHGLTVLNVPGSGGTVPRIIQQPQGTTVTTGTPASFFALVNGSGNLTYQWQKNGTDIGGATNRGHLISSPTTSDSGQYRVIVSNAFGRVISVSATLTVNNLQEDSQLGGRTGTNPVSFRLQNSRLVGDVMELEFVPIDRQPATLTGWRVQASTDLEKWITLPTVPSTTNGAFRVNDPDATRKACRFYRVVRE